MGSLRISRGKLRLRGVLRDVILIAALLTLRYSTGVFGIGLGIFGLGALLHFWSKGCLMRNWVVTTCGPYRLVRHPYYLAAFLVDLGICVMSGNPYLMVIYTPLYLLVYLPVIREEEGELEGTHGEAYREFKRQVPRLLPYKLHRLVGPLDFSWANLQREHEFARLLRVLAAPLYILIVHLAKSMPAREWVHSSALLALAAGALLLNLVSVMVRWDPFDDLADMCPSGGSDRLERLAQKHPAMLAVARVMQRAQAIAGFGLVLASAAGMWYLRQRPFDLHQLNGWVLLGLALVAVGFVVSLAALGAKTETGQLRTAGAYALCRHPGQLGTMLLVAGLCVLTRDWRVGMLAGVYLAAFCSAAILTSEAWMAENHGGAYRDYRAKVPLLLPLGNIRGASFSLGLAMRKGGLLLALAILAVLLGIDRLETRF